MERVRQRPLPREGILRRVDTEGTPEPRYVLCVCGGGCLSFPFPLHALPICKVKGGRKPTMSLPDLTLFNFPSHPEQLSPAVDRPPAHLPPAQAKKLQVRCRRPRFRRTPSRRCARRPEGPRRRGRRVSVPRTALCLRTGWEECRPRTQERATWNRRVPKPGNGLLQRD